MRWAKVQKRVPAETGSMNNYMERLFRQYQNLARFTSLHYGTTDPKIIVQREKALVDLWKIRKILDQNEEWGARVIENELGDEAEKFYAQLTKRKFRQ